MWVRGLKLGNDTLRYSQGTSHPMWVRGLKHIGVELVVIDCAVAPHVGAWIETS